MGEMLKLKNLDTGKIVTIYLDDNNTYNIPEGSFAWPPEEMTYPGDIKGKSVKDTRLTKQEKSK